MAITEPITLLTDYLLAALTACFAVSLWLSTKDSRHVARRQWVGAFAASSVAALFGGSWHGFHTQLPTLVEQLLWRSTTLTIGLAGMLLLLGTLTATVDHPWRQRLGWIVIVKFLIYLVVVNLHDAYYVVIADYVPNLVAVLLLSFWRWRSATFARWAVFGVLVAFVGAGVQTSGLSLHHNFNHNDLYHMIQAVSFWLLYRAGMLLEDRN